MKTHQNPTPENHMSRAVAHSVHPIKVTENPSYISRQGSDRAKEITSDHYIYTGEAVAGIPELLTGEPSVGTVEGGVPATAAETLPTLSKTTVNPLSTGTNGNFAWGVRWSLNNVTSSTNGWIIQHVEVRQDVSAWSPPLREGRTQPIEPGEGSYAGLSTSWYPLWEAWRVTDGTIYVGDTSLPHNADTYGQDPVGEHTAGRTEITGRAAFYNNSFLPMHFQVRGGPPAWALPATNTDPNLGEGTGIISHDLTSTWDGVSGTGATTATTV